MSAVDRLAVAANSAVTGLQQRFSLLLNGSEAVKSHVVEIVQHWEKASTSVLQAEFPFSLQEQMLTDWQTTSQSPPVSITEFSTAIDEYSSLCKLTKYPSSADFWKRELDAAIAAEKLGKTNNDLVVSARLLLGEWQKTFDKGCAEWEFGRISALRHELIKELDAFLQLLQQLHDQLEMLGLDPGLLLDLSKGNLTAQDIQRFQRWAKYMAGDPGVRSLCDLLGKLRQLEISERIERAQIQYTQDIELPDINSREEIVGIRLGRDIEYVLPSELALLADPETSTLFDLKYVESRLMCFDMRGIQLMRQIHEREESQSVEEKEKLGPMVICVDTSGSMSGTPEMVAKAIALFIAGKARQQKRACYLINFSTGIETLNLGDDLGMAELIKFLGMSFHGGTDAIPALDHALEVMQQETYQRADLLMISDFIMFGLPTEMQKQIESLRGNGNCFYSLVIGDFFMSQRLEALFDHEWVYDPQSSQIHELIGFQQRLSGKQKRSVNPSMQ